MWAGAVVCSDAAVCILAGSWCSLAGCLLSYRAEFLRAWYFLGANWQCGVAAAFTATILWSSCLKKRTKPDFETVHLNFAARLLNSMEQPLRLCFLCFGQLLFVIFQSQCPICHSPFFSLSLMLCCRLSYQRNDDDEEEAARERRRRARQERLRQKEEGDLSGEVTEKSEVNAQNR